MTQLSEAMSSVQYQNRGCKIVRENDGLYYVTTHQRDSKSRGSLWKGHKNLEDAYRKLLDYLFFIIPYDVIPVEVKDNSPVIVSSHEEYRNTTFPKEKENS